MAKYRKKPVVIEAEQWFPGKDVKGVINISEGGMGPDGSIWPAYGAIVTLEGAMTVHPGDYIITGIKGEKYACKPDVFKAMYEPVGE